MKLYLTCLIDKPYNITFHSGKFVWGDFHRSLPTGCWAYCMPLNDNIRFPPLDSSMVPQYIPFGVTATGNSHLSPPDVITFISPSSWAFGSGLSPPAPAPASGWGMECPVVVDSDGSVPYAWYMYWIRKYLIYIQILNYEFFILIALMMSIYWTYVVRIDRHSILVNTTSTS